MKQDNPLVIIYTLCFMLILFLISACKEPYREYFIGKWTSSDYETELYIKSDSSFIAKNFIINRDSTYKKQLHGEELFIERQVFFGLNKPWYCYQAIGNEGNEKRLVFRKD